ncbi:unnamed protein product [Porites evermanni]|uniref:Uncharacterized protein n=1 Tax=Porites evermanni TaxID=104178 RepID=A0ABN8SZH6_9CNID|nr:unnamed protein product [Porites evermanni]
MAQSSNILEKRWQRIVYEKHRKRVSKVKRKVDVKMTRRYNGKEYCRLPIVNMNAAAEEKRQAIIDKQNSKLLQRIVDIMTSKKKTFPVSSDTELNRKVSKTSVTDNSKPKARYSSVKLPTITSAVKERRVSK